MNCAIEKAIELLVQQIASNIKGDEALKLTQAALNLAHVKSVLNNLLK